MERELLSPRSPAFPSRSRELPMDPVSTLRPAILARVSDALARELAGLSDLDARLDAIVRAGRDASPDLHVARHAWAAYLAAMVLLPVSSLASDGVRLVTVFER